MKRLNIFIDESGDFGTVENSSELYVVSFTIHESKDDISEELNYLNNKLIQNNHKGMIHMADLVSRRGKYSKKPLEIRKSIFWGIFYFTKRVPVRIKSIFVNKKFVDNESKLNMKISIEMGAFFNKHKEYFSSFDKVVVYYDNGQGQLGTIIDVLLATIPNIDRRVVFDRESKRLFQVSDMLTFIDKLDYKYHNRLSKTKSEKFFFSDEEIRKIISILKNKRMD